MSTPDSPDKAPDKAPDVAQEEPPKKQRRRVHVPPPEGTDPHPEAEPERFPDDDNTDRLKADKPPHWG